MENFYIYIGLLGFIINPFNFSLVKLLFNNTNLFVIIMIFLLLTHLFYSILPEKHQVNSYLIAILTSFSYFIYYISPIKINITFAHILLNIPSYLLYIILNY